MRNYQSLVNHYENCLDRFGDTSRGVDWPNPEDALTRYDQMLAVIQNQNETTRLLDFGCGKADLLSRIQQRNFQNIDYTGLDLSEKFVSFAKNKFPQANFIQADIFDVSYRLPEFDYIIANGVFTIKNELSFYEMLNFMEKALISLFSAAKIGIAFNVMSTQVDWEREDLFHVDLDTMANLIYKKLSPHFEIHHNYGLYEYTTFVYKSAKNASLL
jgi:SAM-dependent methyltransferase